VSTALSAHATNAVAVAPKRKALLPATSGSFSCLLTSNPDIVFLVSLCLGRILYLFGVILQIVVLFRHEKFGFKNEGWRYQDRRFGHSGVGRRALCCAWAD
jgi:hypothetical protein